MGKRNALPQLTTMVPISITNTARAIKVKAADALSIVLIQPQFGHLSVFLAISLPQALHFIISTAAPI
jgi:hypothetical protein